MFYRCTYLLLGVLFLHGCSSTQRAGQWERGIRPLSIDAAGITRVEIRGINGSLDIQGVAGITSVSVAGTVKAIAGDLNVARLLATSTEIIPEGGNEGPLVLTPGFGSSSASGQVTVHLEVTVPASMGLVIEDGDGDLIISGIDSSVSIVDGGGDLLIDGVKGQLSIVDLSGNIRIRDSTGLTLRVRDGIGDMEVSHVQVEGAVLVKEGSGEVAIRYVSGDMDIENQKGQLRFAHFDGDVLLKGGGRHDVEFENFQGNLKFDEDTQK